MLSLDINLDLNSPGSAGSASPPVNTVAPVISCNGPGLVDDAYTLSSVGTWPGATSYSRQWQRDGVDIAGQTGATYTGAVADAGKTITCVVTAHNSAGDSSPASSNGIVAAALSAPVFTVDPVISDHGGGNLAVDSDGTMGGNPPPAISYQWQTGGSDIPGATNPTFAAGSGTLRCHVTATNSEGSDDAFSNEVVVP